jgi:hypothetical protein
MFCYVQFINNAGVKFEIQRTANSNNCSRMPELAISVSIAPSHTDAVLSGPPDPNAALEARNVELHTKRSALISSCSSCVGFLPHASDRTATRPLRSTQVRLKGSFGLNELMAFIRLEK